MKEGAPAFNAAMKDLAKGGKEAFEEELKSRLRPRKWSNGQVDWPPASRKASMMARPLLKRQCPVSWIRTMRCLLAPAAACKQRDKPSFTKRSTSRYRQKNGASRQTIGHPNADGSARRRCANGSAFTEARMSIYDDDELGNLDVVRFETQLGTSKIRFRTPSPPGCTVTLELGDGRPREWDERKKARAPPARFWCPKDPALASGTITIEYFAEDANERDRLRAEHDDFLEMVGSPIPGNPEKKFIINHPACMMMTPPMTECVF